MSGVQTCALPISPTAKEIGFASGKTVLDLKSDAKYLKKLEAATENIQKAFAMPEANAVVCLTALLFSSNASEFWESGSVGSSKI